MASPFRVFRKNQKVAFAILAVMAIIAFVFLPSTGTISGRGGSDPIVVRTTKFGNLHASQLQSLRGQRQYLLGFLASLEAEARQQEDWARMLVVLRKVIGPASEQSVVEKWIFAQQAEELGIAVDDTAINDFLRDITADRISPERILQILQQQRGGLSEGQLFAILREELLALRFRQLFFQLRPGGLSWVSFSIPPGQRWDYYQRLNRFATIEAAQVPVEQYVKDVKDPPKATLEEFFDNYKDKTARPDSPEPGFRQARKVSMQYLEADQAKFLTAVTDSDVMKDYEKNKESYDKYDEELNSQKAERYPEKKPEKAATKNAEKPADTKPAQADAKKSEAPKGEAPKAEAKSPAKEKAAPAGTKSEKPTAAPTPQDATKPKASDKPAAAPAPGSHSEASPPSLMRLVAYAAEKSTPTTTATPPAATPAAATPPAGMPKAPAAATPAAALPAEKKPADAKPAAGPPAEKKTDKKPASPPAAAEAKKPAAAEATKAAVPPMEHPSPLLKQRIREKLAREKATRVLFKLQESLRAYRIQWTQYDAERKRNAQASMPPPPDFVALAKENGLVAAKTGLVSQSDLATTDLGKSVAVNLGESQGQTQVDQEAFQTRIQYSPEMSWDMAGNQYLFWKIDEVPDRVPKFSDEGVADEVLHTWKMVQARKIALDVAEKLKSEAAKAGRPLKEVLADRKEFPVFRPQPFSWLTYGSVPQESMMTMSVPRLSRVEGVSFPGTSFMETVFTLSRNEVGVAANAPEDSFYVIRVLELQPSDADLFKSFTDGDTFARYAAVAAGDQRKVDEAWKAEVLATAGLKWESKSEHHTAATDDED
jgi:hypothetical protein